MRTFLFLPMLAATALSLPMAHAAGLPQRPRLTLEGARQIASAAEALARKVDAPGAAIAIVDDAGIPILVQRLDGTFPMASVVATGKARTAALFGKPTQFFEEAINKGRTAMTALADFTPLTGGVPIEIDGQVIGAIGLSGAASGQQDTEIANGAAAAAKSLLTAH
ncbi:MAG TPA: heme-binding protein [Nevskiaceae bacterium]|nr:heme-binding protein [Nevskiaceae bacterium]